MKTTVGFRFLVYTMVAFIIQFALTLFKLHNGFLFGLTIGYLFISAYLLITEYRNDESYICLAEISGIAHLITAAFFAVCNINTIESGLIGISAAILCFISISRAYALKDKD